MLMPLYWWQHTLHVAQYNIKVLCLEFLPKEVNNLSMSFVSSGLKFKFLSMNQNIKWSVHFIIQNFSSKVDDRLK